MARLLARLWPLVLALTITAPLLAPGYVLAYDMVFVPDQAMRADYLGLGSSLPRAVPSDALVAIASVVLPGQLVQKAVLVGLLLAAGFGMARLLQGAPTVARVAAVSWFVWNPYVAERLLIGQWAVLVGYAALPWAAAAALAARRGSIRAAAAAVLAVGIAGVSASGGLVAGAVVALLLCWPGSAASLRSRALVLGALVAVNAPWIVAGLLNRESVSTSTAAVDAFAASGEGHLPAPLAVLGLGGIWNADTVPGSREGWVAVCWLVVLLGVMAAGIRPMARRFGRSLSLAFGLVAAVSFVVALAGVVDPSRVAAASDHLPGFALLRDGPRYLGGLALVQAIAFGLGVQWLRRNVRPRAAGLIVGAGLVVAPLAVMPDLAWAGSGRLDPVDYPTSWSLARDAVERDGGGGSVLVVPLSPYRAYDWNDQQAGLDPAPRYFPGRSLSSDALTVDGVQVQPENAEAAAAAEAFSGAGGGGDAEPDVPLLADQGVGYVIVDADLDSYRPDTVPVGLRTLYEADDIVVYAVSADPASHELEVGDVTVVSAGWAAALFAWVTSGLLIWHHRGQRRGGMRKSG